MGRAGEKIVWTLKSEGEDIRRNLKEEENGRERSDRWKPTMKGLVQLSYIYLINLRKLIGEYEGFWSYCLVSRCHILRGKLDAPKISYMMIYQRTLFRIHHGKNGPILLQTSAADHSLSLEKKEGSPTRA
jgi:hypothetical protein